MKWPQTPGVCAVVCHSGAARAAWQSLTAAASMRKCVVLRITIWLRRSLLNRGARCLCAPGTRLATGSRVMLCLLSSLVTSGKGCLF